MKLAEASGPRSPAAQRKSKVWLSFFAGLSPQCQLCQGKFWRDLHHIKGLCLFSGGSMKATDFMVAPLCKECHDRCHQDPSAQPLAFKRTWAMAIQSGELRTVEKEYLWTSPAIAIYKSMPWKDEGAAIGLMREWAKLILPNDKHSHGRLARIRWANKKLSREDFCEWAFGWYALCGSRTIYPRGGRP